MSAVFRWSGEYAGFIRSGNLFDTRGNYQGWIEADGRVWGADGQLLGHLVEGSYVLRKTMQLEPMPRLPKLPPLSPLPPLAPLNRLGRLPRMGWEDALQSRILATR